MENQTEEDNHQIRLLDEAFKSYVDDMKPFVLSLSDRKGMNSLSINLNLSILNGIQYSLSLLCMSSI